MAKSKSCKGTGCGWHGQKIRHSNAKRFGKAGGIYTTERIKTLLKEKPEYKKLTFKQLKNKGVKLSFKGEADGDGVKNKKDCRPLDKRFQDNGKPSGTQLGLAGIQGATQSVSVAGGVAKEGLGVVKEGEKQLGSIITKGEDIIIEKEKTKRSNLAERAKEFFKEKQREIEVIKGKKKKEAEERREKQVTRIERELETEEHLTPEDRERIADLNLKELSDKELKILAIKEGSDLFFGNRYEAELNRRIREEAKIETDKTIIINEERERANRKILEAKKSLNQKTFIEELFN